MTYKGKRCRSFEIHDGVRLYCKNEAIIFGFCPECYRKWKKRELKNYKRIDLSGRTM